ncbi:MAG TPA: Rpn family recombination-promoting nuclease/putative transposase [Candidatus Gallacutalibacter pullicola]|uniref:Rpn family recombination-promoting nuclease/putative transposase n=1 Tax=Candidatus Gallacutalibacter pullicola TaxID=2840830 RepID=A0A9D1DSR0_9FIRM|nr:Rpn family recombination-promoting nuclease/putative transposase [Candidatus Gallacutalibacter pullicola]
MAEATEQSRITTREKLIEAGKEYNLLSDAFMSVALRDIPACQYVLRILTGIKNLKVREVRPQYRVSKIESHDAVLDVLAEDETGRLFDLEIQRADTLDHARRTRFYSSMIDSNYLEKGKTYSDLPEVYVIYVSETDLWKAGYTTYELEKKFRKSNVSYDDGQHVLYINAAVNDGSETAKLMDYFKTADPDDMEHGELSQRVHFLKCDEGGLSEMCEVTERIYKMGREDGRDEGRAEGREEEKQATARNLFKLGIPVETIAKAVEVNINLVKEWLSGNGNTSTAG